jgi:hypothetical protein
MIIIYICQIIFWQPATSYNMRSSINIIGLILLITFIATGCKKVEENNPPVITSVTLNPLVVNPDSSTMVKVKATDNDGDLIVYSYTPSGGIIIGNGANVRWLAPDSAGIYTLIIKASDDKGGVTIDSTAILEVREVVTPTQLQGTATFAVGMEGDISYSRVAIYASLADREAGLPQKSIITSSGNYSLVNFTMTGITPGDYYLDVWKDNDNSLTYSNGDYLGWYGSGNLLNQQLYQIQIAEGETKHITIQMYIY